MTLAIAETVYAPLNTPIDGDRDYYDLTGLDACACGSGNSLEACLCNPGLGDFMQDMKIWGVPLVLMGILMLPSIVSAFSGEQSRSGW